MQIPASLSGLTVDMYQLHGQPEHAVGVFPPEGRGGWGLPRGKSLFTASHYHLLGCVVHGLGDEWVIEPASGSLRKQTNSFYTFHIVRGGFSVGSCIRKKGSLNTNFNSERNFADILTRCSSLLQSESYRPEED